MSYQLVFTSAAHLLDAGAAPGYGVVARTAGISKALADKLAAISGFREHGVSGIVGPQCSYRRLEHRGTRYHVLTVAQSASADYSGRPCYIAHHLVLSPDEVSVMRHNSKRPTPAGLIVALEKSGFWFKRWEGEPRELSGEPRLSASLLPDASMQVTWKALSGHKGNARAFFTPPYEGECLCLVPEGISSEQVLLLINESDWLSSTRGWGRTFTTHGNEVDSFMVTQRIFATEGTSLQERAYRSQRPILRIFPDLILPAPDPEDDTRYPQPDSNKEVASPPSRVHLPAGSVNLAGWPYRYCESADSETYDLPPKRLNWLRLGGLMLGLGVLAAGIGLLVTERDRLLPSRPARTSGLTANTAQGNTAPILSPGAAPSTAPSMAHGAAGELVPGLGTTQTPPASSSGEAVSYGAGDIIGQLARLCGMPFSHKDSQLELDRLAARAQQLPFPDSLETQRLVDSLNALRRAGSISGGYADDLSLLLDYAESTRSTPPGDAPPLDARALFRLFMNEATHARAQDDPQWHASLLADLENWKALLTRHPDLRYWLHADFAPYADRLLQHCSSNTRPTLTSDLRDQILIASGSVDAPLDPPTAGHTGYPEPPLCANGTAPGAATPPGLAASGNNGATLPPEPLALAEGCRSRQIRDMLARAVDRPVTGGDLMLSTKLGRDASMLRINLSSGPYSLCVSRSDAATSGAESYSISLQREDGGTASDFLIELAFEGDILTKLACNGKPFAVATLPLPDSGGELRQVILASAVEIPVTFSWEHMQHSELPCRYLRLISDCVTGNFIRFKLEGQDLNSPPWNALGTPLLLPAAGSESNISLPRLGRPSVLCAIENITLDGRPCRIDFPLLSGRHSGRVYSPRFSCNFDCEQDLLHRLDELAVCHYVGQSSESSFPLGALHYIAQQAAAENVSTNCLTNDLTKASANDSASAGEGMSEERCRQLLRSCIGSSVSSLLRPYLFINCSMAPRDEQGLKQDIIESPRNARALCTRLNEIVFGDLSNTYEELIHRFASAQRDISCILKLRRIEIIDNRLYWQFEAEELSHSQP